MNGETDGFGTPVGDEDRQRLGDILSESFAFPPQLAATWFAYAGHENLRVFRREGVVGAGLVRIPMGQFWGGRSVKVCGVAGVGVAPWERGRGVGTRMMAEALREMREDGYALSALYPATQPLYRRVGYEQAGSRLEITGRLDALPSFDRDLPMRAVAPDDLAGVERAYSAVARDRPGWLDRGHYVWHRVRQPRAGPAWGYVIGAPGEVEGYVFLMRPLKPSGRSDVVITDMVALSPRGWRRILSFLRDQASISVDLTWFGGADDPLLFMLDEPSFVLTSHEPWMIRLLDVEKAMAQRGFTPGLSASFELEIADELFTENAGRWILEVFGGEGRARRGGQGKVRCHVRSLASMYANFRNARALAALGAVEGPPDALEAACALFSGGAPSMPDMF